MNNDLRLLKGSPSRDIFKQMHKTLHRSFYACDIDFVLVGNRPHRPAGIIAFLDFKLPQDKVTFSEVLAYNDLLKIAPVYIIESPNPETGPFAIRRFLSGVINRYPAKPSIALDNAEMCCDWEAFEVWERKIRNNTTR